MTEMLPDKKLKLSEGKKMGPGETLNESAEMLSIKVLKCTKIDCHVKISFKANDGWLW